MATINTTTSLAGLFKQSYGESVIDATKTKARISSRVGFDVKELLGSTYNNPVRVAMEAGITALAADDAGSTALIAVNTGTMKNAQVPGSQLIGQSKINYEAIYKAAAAGPKAFKSATKEVVTALSNSMVKRLETMILHGQRGIGTISSVSSATITFTDESWSAGIWAGSEGHTLDCWNAGLTAEVGTGGATISSVNPTNKTITLSASVDAAWVAGCHLFWDSHSPTTEFAGLDKIIRNSGSLFGIDASTYALWAGNTYSTSTGVLSMAKLLEAVGLTASYGGDKDVIAVVSPRAFETLNSDQAALRQFDVSYSSTAKNGYRGIKFAGQVGDIEIMPHPYQKDGLCHVFCPEEAMRIGATDLTFIRRNGSEDVLVLEDATYGGSIMRCYSNQALFIEVPRHTVLLGGITF